MGCRAPFRSPSLRLSNVVAFGHLLNRPDAAPGNPGPAGLPYNRSAQCGKVYCSCCTAVLLCALVCTTLCSCAVLTNVRPRCRCTAAVPPAVRSSHMHRCPAAVAEQRGCAAGAVGGCDGGGCGGRRGGGAAADGGADAGRQGPVGKQVGVCTVGRGGGGWPGLGRVWDVHASGLWLLWAMRCRVGCLRGARLWLPSPGVPRKGGETSAIGRCCRDMNLIQVRIWREACFPAVRSCCCCCSGRLAEPQVS